MVQHSALGRDIARKMATTLEVAIATGSIDLSIGLVEGFPSKNQKWPSVGKTRWSSNFGRRNALPKELSGCISVAHSPKMRSDMWLGVSPRKV